MCASDSNARAAIVDRLADMIEVPEEVDGGLGEATRLDALGLDSLAVLDLIFDLEEEFGVQIPAETMEEMETVGDLVTLLREQGA